MTEILKTGPWDLDRRRRRRSGRTTARRSLTWRFTRRIQTKPGHTFRQRAQPFALSIIC